MMIIKKFNLLLVNTILFYTGLHISEVISLNKTQILELFTNEELNLFCSKSESNENDLFIYTLEDLK